MSKVCSNRHAQVSAASGDCQGKGMSMTFTFKQALQSGHRHAWTTAHLFEQVHTCLEMVVIGSYACKQLSCLARPQAWHKL